MDQATAQRRTGQPVAGREDAPHSPASLQGDRPGAAVAGPAAGALQAMSAMMNRAPRAVAQGRLAGTVAASPHVVALRAIDAAINGEAGADGHATVQLRRKKKPRLPSTLLAPVPVAPVAAASEEESDGESDGEAASDAGEEEATNYVMATEGAKSPYEESYTTPKIFWRGDDRAPDAVFATGFTTTNERNHVTLPGANKIIWRDGGGLDDVLPASAVCLAKDIRGSAFFPLTGAANFYIYAVAKLTVVSTFKAQQEVEQHATRTNKFRRPERYQYDPAYENGDDASAVWQFKEHAAHRVESTEMLAAFRVERQTLIPPYGDESVAIGGIRFRLSFDAAAPIPDAFPKKKKQLQRKLINDAKSVAGQFAHYYPADNQFLSYMGTVKRRDGAEAPTTLENAKDRVDQVQPVVAQRAALAQPDTPPAHGTSTTA